MEQCRIPIAVCERIIDSVGPLEDRERPTTLLRCALTCRAWHFRARRCLWGGPLYIHGAHRFNIFVAGLRHTPDFLTSHVQTLVLHDDSPPASTPGVHPTLYRLNEFLFTRRLPNLRNLELRALKDSSLDLLQGTRVLRMGLSLPTGLTTLTLTLTECPSFSNSVCNIHDVIRACQNLVSLVISFSDQAHGSESRGIQPHGLNVDTYAGSTRNHSWRHIGPPCGTLQNLVVHCRGHDNNVRKQFLSCLPIALFQFGSFGASVTHLSIDLWPSTEVVHGDRTIKHTLWDIYAAFQALTTLDIRLHRGSVHTCPMWETLRSISCLIPIRSNLKRIDIQYLSPHDPLTTNCKDCKVNLERFDEEKLGSIGDKGALEEVCIWMKGEVIERWGRQIASILRPDLRDILRFVSLDTNASTPANGRYVVHDWMPQNVSHRW